MKFNVQQKALDEAQKAIQQAGSGDLTSIFSQFLNSAVGAWIWFIAKIIVSLAVLIFGALAIWKFWLQYNIKVSLWRATAGGGKQIVKERARVIRDDQGKRKLELWKTRDGGEPVTCPVPDSKYKILERGWFITRDKYNLYLDENMEPQPIRPAELMDTRRRDPQMSVDRQNRRAWSKLEDKRIEEKHSFLEKWQQVLPYAAIAVTGVICFLIFFFAFRQLGSGMAEMSTTFRQIAASCTKLA